MTRPRCVRVPGNNLVRIESWGESFYGVANGAIAVVCERKRNFGEWNITDPVTMGVAFTTSQPPFLRSVVNSVYPGRRRLHVSPAEFYSRRSRLCSPSLVTHISKYDDEIRMGYDLGIWPPYSNWVVRLRVYCFGMFLWGSIGSSHMNASELVKIWFSHKSRLDKFKTGRITDRRHPKIFTSTALIWDHTKFEHLRPHRTPIKRIQYII